MTQLKKIATTLWFNDQAEEAARHYISIFKDSELGRIARYGKEGFEFHKKPAGSVMTIEFKIDGQTFVGLNGGSMFKFNESISFIVYCDTQDEIDYYWEKLGEGGDEKAKVCGWLKDKFGVSWQIVPTILPDLVGENADPVKAARVMSALYPMKKLDIAALKKAAESE